MRRQRPFANFRCRLLIALAVASALAGTAQAQNNSKTGTGPDRARSAPVSGATSAWISGPLVKVLRDDAAGTAQSLQISAARNEFESFQVHVRAGTNPVQMNVTVSDFVKSGSPAISSATNVFIHREAYLNITTKSDQNGTLGWTPDPLIPAVDSTFKEARNAFPFSVPSGMVQSAWIDVLVPSTAAAGNYTATVTVKDGSLVVATMSVTLKVWSFVLPSTATLKSAFGLSWNALCVQAYGGYTNCNQYPGSGGSSDTAIHLTHVSEAQLFLDHRVSVDVVYATSDMSTLDFYYGPLLDGTSTGTSLSGAKLTTLRYTAPGYRLSDIPLWVSHFSAKGWLGGLFYYTCDEPPNGCTWDYALTTEQAVHNGSSQMKNLVTTDLAHATANNLLADLNIIVPLVNDLDPQGGTNQRASYNSWLAGSDKHIWWYQSCSSHGSCSNGTVGPAESTWPSYMVDATPVRNRVFQWLGFLNRIEGELYYATDYCWIGIGGSPCADPDPWVSIYAFGGNGDGTLIYPGTAAKIGGTNPVAVPSIRLKHIRDGMEDFEYLKALSNMGEDAFARATAASFITTSTDFFNDAQKLSNAREALGDLLHRMTGSSGTAVMKTPAPGSTLAGFSVTFDWTAGSGVTQYWLTVGTGGVGSADIYHQSTGTNRSVTVGGLPVAGQTVYVRLWSLITGTWRSNDYTYTAATAQKAVLTTPTPGSTLSNATTMFGWDAGIGISQYWLTVGTTGVGSSNVYNQSAGTGQSATVNNVFAVGTVYVRLWSLISGSWQSSDYTYTATTAVKAALTTPAPGSTLANATVNFGWSSGVGVSQFWLYVGTAGVGSSNIFGGSTGTIPSKSVTGVPISGIVVYVRLWSLISGNWLFTDYTYFTQPQTAEMSSPIPGTTLAGTSVTFTWTAGNGVTQYWLYVGTGGVGSSDLYNQSRASGIMSASVSGLPSTGGPLYVRLYSLLGGVWQFKDYTYTAASGQKAVLTTPSPNTTLSGAAQTFGWTAGVGVTQYWLYVGTIGAGSTNIFTGSTGTSLSKAISGLPANGSTVYVRLWSLIAGSWVFDDYLYRAAGTATCAVLSSPTPGATLPSPEPTFVWSAIGGASRYWLSLGTTGVGSNEVLSSEVLGTSYTVASPVPANGNWLYVRLWTFVGGSWCFTDTIHRTPQGGKANVTSPAPDTTLSGTAVTFQWDSGVGVAQYWLYVGTTGAGSANITNASNGQSLSRAVTGLPSDGGTVYVRLYSQIAGVWQFNDYLYRATGAGALAQITSPTPASALTSGTVTFQWSTGTGVTQYWLYVGTSAGGSDVYNSSTGTARQMTVSGLPTNGKTVYVRLWSLIGGSWKFNDYGYAAGVLLTDDLLLWQSRAAGWSNVASGYGTTSTALGSGAVNYPTASIVNANSVDWTTWCCGYTGNIAYFTGSSSVTITLTGVAGFGFQAEPNPFSSGVQGMTVTLSNGETITDNVNGYYGAQFFGFVGKGITSITITNNSGNDFAIGNFYVLPDTTGIAGVTVASADNSVVLSGGTASVPATGTCSTLQCNSAGAQRR